MLSDQSTTMSIVLKSSDEEIFKMEEAEAQLSPLIKRMIEDGSAKTCIPIPNVTGNILSKVIEYCRKHVKIADDNEALRSFEGEFVDVDEETLVHLGKAAKFLEMKRMLFLVCRTVTDRICDKSDEEIREMFKIEKPAEELDVYCAL